MPGPFSLVSHPSRNVVNETGYDYDLPGPPSARLHTLQISSVVNKEKRERVDADEHS